MSIEITHSSIAQRNQDMIDANIDGETVMMSIENGQYYGLDPIASRIWESIESPRSVESICSTLIDEYDVSKEQCQADVIQFLDLLRANRIIEIKV